MRFDGKTAIITGGASGLGRASACRFLEEGANVVILDIDRDAGVNTVEQLGHKGNIKFLFCDVTDENSVREAFEKTAELFGGADIVHANAGIINKPNYVHEMSFAEWNRIININLNGMFLTSKYAIKHFLTRGGGVMVFTGSNWAYVCDPGFSSYAASKGAVVSFARALALDHAKDNIRINVVCPGNILTPLLEKQLSLEKDPEAVLKAMGQISRPEEIANLVVFLASDEASAMKGSAVIIDQGETLGYGKGLGVQK